MALTPAAFDTTPLPFLRDGGDLTSGPVDDPWSTVHRSPAHGSVALPLLDLQGELAGEDETQGQYAITVMNSQ